MVKIENKVVKKIEIIENIKKILDTDNVSFQSFAGEIQKLLSTVDNLDKESLDYILKELKDLILELRPMMSALISVACGYLIENGANPMIVVNELLKKVENLLSLAMEFNNACFKAGVPNSDDPHSIIDSVKKKMPLETEAWDALDKIYPAVVSMLSKSKEARLIAQSYSNLKDLALDLIRSIQGAEWLARILSVLDDEDMLIFYPEKDLGYKIRISGISNSYQLHLLLAGALIGDEKDGWIPGTPPDPKLISYMTNTHYIGDARTNGYFEMKNWKASKPDGRLVQMFENYKGVRFDYYAIWGGEPAIEIPKFEDIRIVFLELAETGKIKINRNFNARREFQFLDAELKVLEKLPKNKVIDWLNRIKMANQ